MHGLSGPPISTAARFCRPAEGQRCCSVQLTSQVRLHHNIQACMRSLMVCAPLSSRRRADVAAGTPGARSASSASANAAWMAVIGQRTVARVAADQRSDMLAPKGLSACLVFEERGASDQYIPRGTFLECDTWELLITCTCPPLSNSLSHLVSTPRSSKPAKQGTDRCIMPLHGNFPFQSSWRTDTVVAR